ncbi:hypothetical protein HMPREF0653_01416 [Prevotella disiens JCM 6334 = ATCC 29426]|uniref:Uncharacterized protein n=1 Tax=Prevotella disiens JCM 6334 = ATCC 29426 TaxID=1235811 RepID=A0ABN0NRZ0_9BACT|nr:hypothetical protein HMPREF0653_01416 [Prevotella disiens JCM 6334 = ATCC 29426]
MCKGKNIFLIISKLKAKKCRLSILPTCLYRNKVKDQDALFVILWSKCFYF